MGLFGTTVARAYVLLGATGYALGMYYSIQGPVLSAMIPNGMEAELYGFMCKPSIFFFSSQSSRQGHWSAFSFMKISTVCARLGEFC